MPRPPILPVPDRQAIFAAGKTFTDWLAVSQEPDNARAIAAAVDTIDVPAAVRDALAALARPVHVIAIAETWCGDVVRHVPVLMKLAAANPLLQVRFIARADHPDYFARFLTNGGEAVPKFVFLSADFVETGNWGPMSTTPREMIARGKACGDIAAARRHVHAFYEADAHREAVAELAERLRVAAFPGFAVAAD